MASCPRRVHQADRLYVIPPAVITHESGQVVDGNEAPFNNSKTWGTESVEGKSVA